MTPVSDDDLVAHTWNELGAIAGMGGEADISMVSLPIAKVRAIVRDRDARLRDLSAARRADAERIAELEKALKTADEQAVKLEALLEPQIEWDTPTRASLTRKDKTDGE